jgi:hypothetical protein
MGVIMYALAHLDFSNWGIVVSELPAYEIDPQDQTLDLDLRTALRELAAASSPAKIEMAVFDAP